MATTTKPESEWFRPPQFLRLAKTGDSDAFAWVAEPEKGEVYAVKFCVSGSLTWTIMDLDAFFEKLRVAGFKELHRRIDRGERYVFDRDREMPWWNPIIKRSEDGTLTIMESATDGDGTKPST